MEVCFRCSREDPCSKFVPSRFHTIVRVSASFAPNASWADKVAGFWTHPDMIRRTYSRDLPSSAGRLIEALRASSTLEVRHLKFTKMPWAVSGRRKPTLSPLGPMEVLNIRLNGKGFEMSFPVSGAFTPYLVSSAPRLLALSSSNRLKTSLKACHRAAGLTARATAN